jgi:hypothetical protein
MEFDNSRGCRIDVREVSRIHDLRQSSVALKDGALYFVIKVSRENRHPEAIEFSNQVMIDVGRSLRVQRAKRGLRYAQGCEYRDHSFKAESPDPFAAVRYTRSKIRVVSKCFD